MANLEHIAIIMDGNGRWAKKRGLPRVAGHERGAQRFREVVKLANKKGIKAITSFAFSTENWVRSKEEIDVIFGYMIKFLKNYKTELIKENVRFRAIGRRDRVNKSLLEAIEEVESATSSNQGMHLNVAIDYGGRWDIIEAVNKIIAESKDKPSVNILTEEIFAKYLSLGDIKEPDLLIRTSGEERISNFLIWDLAYSEFYFTDVFWPDFNADEFQKAIDEYEARQRRFGGV